MQLVIRAQHLKVKSALILRDPVNAAPILKPNGYGRISRSTAISATAAPPGCSGLPARIDEGLLNLRRSTITSDMRKVRPKHSAQAEDHVAARAIAFALVKPLAGFRISGRLRSCFNGGGLF